MAIRFKFELDGKTQFDRAFQRLDLAITDLSPAWEAVRDAFWEIESDQFASGGGAGASGIWKELSPAYEKIKIAKYGMLAILGGPLIASGSMEKALRGKSGDSVFQSSKDEMAVGAGGKSGQIARYHQQGGGNLPQREVVSFSDKQKRMLQKRIQKSLLDQIRSLSQKGGGFTATENNFTDI